jgi:hypothetical protein
MQNFDKIIQENAELKEILVWKNQRIQALEELLANLRKRHFGSSSEKSGPQQMELFNEAEVISEQAEAAEIVEATTTTTSAGNQRRKKNASAYPPNCHASKLFTICLMQKKSVRMIKPN